MLKRTALALMLLCAGAVHAAPDYFVLVHNHGKIVNTPDTGGGAPGGENNGETPPEEPGVLSMSLAPYAVPAGQVGVPYEFDMSALLTVQGDPEFDPEQVYWGFYDDGVPGLEFDWRGYLTGTPRAFTEDGGLSFEVVAYYQDQDARRVYTITIAPYDYEFKALKVSSGQEHSCAIGVDNQAYCWGDNYDGQLGDGTTETRLLPVMVQGLGSVKDIAADSMTSCALTVAGGVHCWGWPYKGRVGNSAYIEGPVTTPVPVTGMTSGVASIHSASNGAGFCAIKEDKSVWCWGSNEMGELGNGSVNSFSATPTQVQGLPTGAAQIGLSFFGGCALTPEGAVKCWGRNTDGRMGDGYTRNSIYSSAMPVAGFGSGVAQIAVGWAHTCVRTVSGSVSCWGSNSLGVLGRGSLDGYDPMPAQVSGLGAGVTDLVSGVAHMCAKMSSGSVLCWGRNMEGQLGDGTLDDRGVPTPMVGLAGKQVTAIFAEHGNTCVILATQDVMCTGNGLKTGTGAPGGAIKPTKLGSNYAGELDESLE